MSIVSQPAPAVKPAESDARGFADELLAAIDPPADFDVAEAWRDYERWANEHDRWGEYALPEPDSLAARLDGADCLSDRLDSVDEYSRLGRED